MTTTFQQPLSSQAPSHATGITHAPQSLAETDLLGIVGGAEHGEISFTFGLSFGTSPATLPFSADLQQLPVGATDPATVPWTELTPPVKKLASAGLMFP
jgi:hypothetical protein